MASKKIEVQRSVRGQPLEVYIGGLPGVQAVVKARSREIEATAEEILQPHHYSGSTTIQMDRARARGKFATGWVVTLIDRTGGYEGAIEYGRDDYLVENSEEARTQGYRDAITTRKTAPKVYTRVRVRRALGEIYGGMDGLFILTRAVKAVAARHRREFR